MFLSARSGYEKYFSWCSCTSNKLFNRVCFSSFPPRMRVNHLQVYKLSICLKLVWMKYRFENVLARMPGSSNVFAVCEFLQLSSRRHQRYSWNTRVIPDQTSLPAIFFPGLCHPDPLVVTLVIRVLEFSLELISHQRPCHKYEINHDSLPYIAGEVFVLI